MNQAFIIPFIANHGFQGSPPVRFSFLAVEAGQRSVSTRKPIGTPARVNPWELGKLSAVGTCT